MAMIIITSIQPHNSSLPLPLTLKYQGAGKLLYIFIWCC